MVQTKLTLLGQIVEGNDGDWLHTNAVKVIDIPDDCTITFVDASGIVHLGFGPFTDNVDGMEVQRFERVVTYPAWRVLSVETTRDANGA